MTRVLTLGLLGTFGCAGYPQPDTFTGHGLGVHTNGLETDGEDLELATEWVLRLYDEEPMREALTRMRGSVEFIPYEPEVGLAGVTYNHYYTHESWARIHRTTPYETNTLFVHELIHILEYQTYGREDSSHSNKAVWRSYDGSLADTTSVENQAILASWEDIRPTEAK